MHTLSNGIVVGSALTSAKSKSFLTSQAVADAIKPNRYRFVFLDGCQTAATNGNWPTTFGAALTNTTIDYYTNSATNPKHLRPNVFVGWIHDIGGPGWGTVDEFYNFRSYWMGYWANSFPPETLRNSFSYGNRDSTWLVDFVFWDNIRIYGYGDMKIKEFNSQGDWKWP